MNKFNIQIAAIEARVASCSCPLGTSSHLHVAQLRRRFQPQSTTSPGSRNLSTVHDVPAGRVSNSNYDYGHEWQRILSKASPHESSQGPEDLGKALSLSEEIGRNRSGARDVKPEAIDGRRGNILTGSLPYVCSRPPSLRYRIRKIFGDLYRSPFAMEGFNIDPQHPAGIELDQALRSGNAHAILGALIPLIRVENGGFQGHKILGTLSPAAFSEILRTLDPVKFVGRYVELHRNIGSKNTAFLGLQSHWPTGHHQFTVEFMARIKSVIGARRSVGHTLSISDYKYLLRCARAVGNPTASKVIWYAMEHAGVEPDTDCYNHYLATSIWSDAIHATRRHDLRILPMHMELRRLEFPPPEFEGHKVGPGVGIKHQTIMMFHQMVRSGHVGDEETFCLLMVAMAREGDVDGVKSVMNKAWDIDVDCIMKSSEGDVAPPKFFAIDSPLRPSKTLLMSLAHVFSINNDIPVALRLVDYVSKSYSLEIPMQVWEELLEGTYMLSVPRTLRAKVKEGKSTGLLPREAVSSLWTAMIGEPYNIKPTVSMYDKIIVNELRRQRFKIAQQLIREALELRLNEFREYKGTRSLIQQYRSLPYVERGGPEHHTLLDLQRDEVYQHFRIRRSRVYLRRWCRLFIKLGSRSLRGNPTFTSVNLPQFVEQYMPFMPRTIEYPIATGYVLFPSQYRQLNGNTVHFYKAAEMWSPRIKPMPVSRKMTDGAKLDPLSDSEEMGEMDSLLVEMEVTSSDDLDHPLDLKQASSRHS